MLKGDSRLLDGCIGREALRRILMSHGLHHVVAKVVDDRGNELLVVKKLA